MRYIETYIVGDNKFAIEDYKDGQPDKTHFFAHLPHKRFGLWANGCGIGQQATLTRARKALHARIVRGEKTALEGHQKAEKKHAYHLQVLRDDVRQLSRFQHND